MSRSAHRLPALGALFVLLIAGLSATGPVAGAAEVLTVAISAPPDPMLPGQAVTSSLTVTNSGDTDAAAFPVVITLPKFVASTPHPTRTVSIKNGLACTTVTPRYGATRKTCTVPTLAAGATLQIATVKYVPPALNPFPYSGVGTVLYLSGPTNSVSTAYRWRQPGPPNLSVGVISLSPGTALAGTGPVVGTGSLANSAYGGAGGFGWHVRVPAGATGLAVPTGVAGTVCGPGGDGFDCLTTGLANGASLSYSFSFTAPTVSGAYDSTVTVDTGSSVAESDETDNQAGSSTLTVPGAAANLTISATNPATAAQYSTFRRTVTVTNVGGSTADNVSFNDYMTVGLFEVYSLAAVPPGTNCHRYVTYSGRPTKAHYHGVSCTVGSIAPGASVQVPYDLYVTNTAAGTYTSTLSASTTSYTDPASTPTGTTALGVFVPSPVNAPLGLTPPAVSGDTNTGSTLTSTNGTWIGAGAISYAPRWWRCNAAGNACTDTGVTGSTYMIGAGDVGATLRIAVTATNAGGPATATSAATAVVIGAAAPILVTAPLLHPGLEKQPGFAWSVDTGTWSGTPTITYQYQWLRCAVGGGSCVEIAGATASTFVLTVDEVVHSVQVRVTATNTGGSAIAYSDVSPEIDPFG